ncbi:MAG: polymer-forming cytoskeletal protein [Rhodoferax sp.]|uniref:bactofilin family protein n=1 Tax=Rhodoferax sp. TaxID=50421 RepID=UPI00260ABB9E|nr:polymer-forming cytoskeletal protein [Rhodoferax sp.]MDD5333245.1 polymer-forming cytoskeletal protein [Rhodoferax sp.]
MAITPHFFNKREPLNPVRQGTPASHPASGVASGGASAPPTVMPVAANPVAPSAPARESGSKLTVGPNIKLKGVEITDCDTLLVEGMVEATMDSRLMQISEQGAFKGSAEIDLAEIHGQFEGNLTVRQKLVIHATGKVTGKVRYGKIVIEEGGQLTGDIQSGAVAVARAVSPEKSGLSVVA